MLRGGYSFEKYSVALPYREGDELSTDVVANEARALRARSYMALVSQNVYNVQFVPGYVAHYQSTVIKAHVEISSAQN